MPLRLLPAAQGRIGRFSGPELYMAIFSIESEIDFHALYLPKISYPQAANFGKFIYHTAVYEYFFILLFFLVSNFELKRIMPTVEVKAKIWASHPTTFVFMS